MRDRSNGRTLSQAIPKPPLPRKLRAGVKPRTLPPGDLTRAERAELVAQEAELRAAGAYDRRPRTFAECPPGPCPWASCQHSLLIDVNQRTEAITVRFPELDVDEVKETCSLRAAARGGMSDDQVAKLMNLTRDAVNKMLEGILRKVKRNGVHALLAAAPDR